MEKEYNAILIVDDEESLRNTFRIFLTRAGYDHVQAVATFDEALAAVGQRNYDLIICDIVLESHSGIDLLKRFKEMGIDCPVVIITGYPHVDTASEAVRLGAFDYISKPVEKETLLRTARLALQQYRLEQEKKKADADRDQFRNVIEAIFKSVSDTIISVDENLVILETNHFIHKIFSRVEISLLPGQNLCDGLSHTDLQILCNLAGDVLQSGIGITDQRLECALETEKKLLSICISPLISEGTEEKSILGAVLVIRDITYRQQCQPTQISKLHKMIGASPAMQEVFTLIRNIGKVDTSVLVTGESGTGKELAVDALHQESRRRDKPLVKVDCTAIPDNLLESELFGHKKGAFTGATEDREGRIFQAKGGTLFLDEIGDISQMMQLRLLRFLQERTYYPVGSDKEVRVDVRVIAATNADLKEKVKEGTFREDLYFRLLIIDVNLPPLRERRGDVELLANQFIRKFSRKLGKNITGFSDQALQLLAGYSWPGNVRQLEHTIERACVLCPAATISSDQLPADIIASTPVVMDLPKIPIANEIVEPAPSVNTPLSPPERNQNEETRTKIVEALKKTGGNKAKAARLLQIDRSTLYRKIHELHIEPKSIEPCP